MLQVLGLGPLLRAAYLSYQRVAVATELVALEMRENGDFFAKAGRFWQMAQVRANRAVETTYVLMRAALPAASPSSSSPRPSSPPSPPWPVLGRSLVPRIHRCMRVERNRNLRDWLVLADSYRMADFYHRALAEVARAAAAAAAA